MKLHELSPPSRSRKMSRRLGRGIGTGRGKTAGRGTKGYNSRSGGGVRPGYEGGQMPIQRRLPKRGFTNIFRKKIAVINIRDLLTFKSGSLVDEAALIKAGLIKGKKDGIKLLGQGEIDLALNVKLSHVSKGAKEKIEAAGGSVEVV
ncbi:MAG: 50S ribosomal protein L15 [Desulfobacterales bacterium]